MTDDDMTGPWVLALGTLAVGVAALTAEVLRQRMGGDADRDGGDEGTTREQSDRAKKRERDAESS